ncbi:MAG: non-reducing end alpha-L-arabinofuranosidase, partial [Actinomycetota bacterium]|nr:non-reducing end alpha-L-arabinofuranosidase [Actinomycetota bacterium]
MADLEWGLFSGVNQGHNSNPTINHRFVTAIVKGEPNHWAIRSGDAQVGGLSTVFNGPRPKGYHPMKKQGAIILGIGGDNSTSGAGTFYEGVMTSGYPSDATEEAVQANITAAGYAPPGGGNPQPGAQIVGSRSGRCIEVPNGSSTNGTITGVQSGLCVDADGAGTTGGTKSHSLVLQRRHQSTVEPTQVIAQGRQGRPGGRGTVLTVAGPGPYGPGPAQCPRTSGEPVGA